MVEYDPLNELTQQQLDKVADENFDDFLNYLDQKTEYLKQFTKPLGTYQTKNYASLSKGRTLTLEELQRAIDNCDGIINAVERLNTKKNDI